MNLPIWPSRHLIQEPVLVINIHGLASLRYQKTVGKYDRLNGYGVRSLDHPITRCRVQQWLIPGENGIAMATRGDAR